MGGNGSTRQPHSSTPESHQTARKAPRSPASPVGHSDTGPLSSTSRRVQEDGICMACGGTGTEPIGDGTTDALCSFCSGSGNTGEFMGRDGRPVIRPIKPSDDPDEQAPF